ncbi:DUF2017 family protein [Amnibacterium endophyticum]|uniref:DUF2017 family protein n=1 Tax=Amnibacterium endophyticum TaxID=2109337 RepID=A0ABW4LF22_9MICO
MQILGEFRRHDGAIERRFTKAERRMMGNLVGGLVDTLAQTDELKSYDDAVLRRLLPAAAPDDPDASAEFAAATRGRLAEAKSAGARRVTADLEAAPGGTVRLDEEGAVVWLKTLGDLRLALAERVGFDALTGGRTPQALVYGWLTWLQGSLVEALDQ